MYFKHLTSIFVELSFNSTTKGSSLFFRPKFDNITDLDDIWYVSIKYESFTSTALFCNERALE
jgi:hypothetical protein